MYLIRALFLGIVGGAVCSLFVAYLPAMAMMGLADTEQIIELCLFCSIFAYVFIRVSGNEFDLYMLAFTAWLPVAVALAVFIGLAQFVTKGLRHEKPEMYPLSAKV